MCESLINIKFELISSQCEKLKINKFNHCYKMGFSPISGIFQKFRGDSWGEENNCFTSISCAKLIATVFISIESKDSISDLPIPSPLQLLASFKSWSVLISGHLVSGPYVPAAISSYHSCVVRMFLSHVSVNRGFLPLSSFRPSQSPPNAPVKKVSIFSMLQVIIQLQV